MTSKDDFVLKLANGVMMHFSAFIIKQTEEKGALAGNSNKH